MVFTGQDLAEILRNLAEDLGLRAVLDPAVKGPVATTIANLDAASALEAILRTQSTPFAFEVKDGQLRVFPSRPRTAAPQPLPPTPAPGPAPVVTPPTSSLPDNTSQARAVFPIHGRQAGAVAEGLKALYPQVVFQVDERLNVILVEGEPDQVEQIRKVLSVFAQP
jgi:type II secretory pathway component GspD/PulD (secretin)